MTGAEVIPELTPEQRADAFEADLEQDMVTCQKRVEQGEEMIVGLKEMALKAADRYAIWRLYRTGSVPPQKQGK